MDGYSRELAIIAVAALCGLVGGIVTRLVMAWM